MAGVGEVGPRQMHNGPMAVEDLGRKGLRGGREQAGWKWRERERQLGVEKVGEGRGDVVGSN